MKLHGGCCCINSMLKLKQWSLGIWNFTWQLVARQPCKCRKLKISTTYDRIQKCHRPKVTSTGRQEGSLGKSSDYQGSGSKHNAQWICQITRILALFLWLLSNWSLHHYQSPDFLLRFASRNYLFSFLISVIISGHKPQNFASSCAQPNKRLPCIY